MAKRIPNPGSPAAVKAGCLCPVIDNGHGKGAGWGKGKFWINADCPLHGTANVVRGAHKVRRD